MGLPGDPGDPGIDGVPGMKVCVYLHNLCTILFEKSTTARIYLTHSFMILFLDDGRVFQVFQGLMALLELTGFLAEQVHQEKQYVCIYVCVVLCVRD